ncbi:hypothetical protein [Aeromicrobium sp. HA]|uniref:hypothetical protein n=1 Tax=Aeromicrobium sp. HA TaxID=3009077 RepID=UPI0022AEDB76|nr:hypothetical protein [Aeromicrobium sp. HA]
MKNFLNGLLGLILLAAVVTGAALGGRWLLRWLFEGVNPTVAAAIVAAAATTIVSVLGVTLGRYLERRDQIELELRQRKIPIYIEFVEGIMKMFFNSVSESGGTNLVEKKAGEGPFDLVEFFKKMTPQLMIWASNDVVSSWSRFRRGADKTPPIDYMFMMEDLLAAIRKDLGHNGQMAKGDLLGTYINDIDEVLAKEA